MRVNFRIFQTEKTENVVNGPFDNKSKGASQGFIIIPGVE